MSGAQGSADAAPVKKRRSGRCRSWRRKSGKDRNRGFLQKTSGGRKTASGLLHGFLRGFRNRLIGKFLADARQIGDLVLAVFGEVVVLAGAAVAFQERVAVEFVDREVRNSRLKLQGGRGHDRAAADMDLAGRVVDVAHVADLLRFGHAAAGADVGLNEVDNVVFEEGAIAPAREDAFAGGDRDADMFADFLQAHRIEVHHRLFVGGDAEFLDHAAEFDRRNLVGKGMGLNNDVDVVADRFANCLQALVADHQVAAGKSAVEVALLGKALLIDFVDVDLDAVVALFDGPGPQRRRTVQG